MDRTWKLVALALPAVLGLAVSAYAMPSRHRPAPPTTTVVTTMAAATTTAAAATTAPLVTTTDPPVTTTDPPVTTTDPPVTTMAAPAPILARITSPINGTWYPRGTAVFFNAQFDGDGATCLVEWGDGSSSTTVNGMCRCSSCGCSAAHIYLKSGPQEIKFTATSRDGTVAAGTVRITVI
jgi:hypothetical protein